jgi:hypothetical protein
VYFLNFSEFELEKLRKRHSEVFIQGQKGKNVGQKRNTGWEEKNSNIKLDRLRKAH